MNEWTIYDKSGSVRAEVKELEYHGEWLGEEYVTVTVKSATPVAFEHGDFLEYRNAGDTYVIDYDPAAIKCAESGKYQEAFVYENVKLYSEGHALKDVLFKDYVLDDNCLAYSQQAKFSFFAKSVEDLADRLQANLNKAFGDNVWKVFTPDEFDTNNRHNSGRAWYDFYSNFEEYWDFPIETGLTDINVNCDGISCFDALRQSYDLFGLPFVFVGKNIIIGGNRNTVIGRRFSYGKGNGLYEIEKSTDEQKQVVTKMYAYGSSENMPLNYYANLHKYYFAEATDIEVSSDISTIGTDPYPYIQLRMDVDFMRSMFTNVNTWTDSDGNTYKNLGYVVRVRLDTTSITITARVNNPAPVDDDGKVHIYAEYSGGEDPADEPSVINMREFIRAVYQKFRGGNSVKLIFERGIDVNRWPQDGIGYTQQNTYPALLSISNLMLPGFPDQSLYAWVKSHTGTNCNDTTGLATWHGMTAYFSKDAMNPWIKSLNAETYGEKEGAVYFDGSNQDVKNVKPTIENTGANYASAKTTIQDNGYLADGTDLSFTLAVPVSNAVNWEEIWLNRSEDMYVNMISGYCTGRSFRVLSRPVIKLDNQGYYWALKLERSKDSSLDRYFPYQDTVDGSDYAQISQSDYLNVTGVQLPKSYVDAAAEVLLEEALKALGRLDHPKMVYVPRIDEIFAARDRDAGQPGESFYDKIRPGMQLRFADADFFGVDGGTPIVMTRFIDQLTIKENGNNGIPTFDVVLRDEKDETLEQRIANQISSMSGGSSSGSGSSSGGGSGEGGISTEELEAALETKVDTDWMSMLFEVHRRTPSEEEGGETLDEVIPPNDYADLTPDDPTISIKAKYGLWTEQFLSARGLGPSGGGGSTDLNWPLDAINDAGMSMNPNAGDTIVYDGDGGFYWGNAGVDEGRVNTLIATYLSDNDYKTETELDVRYLQKASESTQNISLLLRGSINQLGNYILTGGLNVDGSIRLLRGSDNPDDADILNMGETMSLIENVGDGRYVKIDFFERLLRVHNGNNIISTNGAFPQDTSGVNIEAMFGFWTEQYLSARGLGPSGGGGGLNLNEPLLSINNTVFSSSHPSQAGQTIVWNGSKWAYGSTGADQAQIQSIVNNTLSAYRWWGRPADANNSVIGDMINVGDISFQTSGKNIGGLVFFDTTYHHVGIGSAPFVPSTGQTGYTLDVTGNIRATQTSWFPAIELRGTQASPNTYIDFHYGTIENDYTNRIIEEQETVGGNEYRYLRIRTAAGKAGLVIGNSTNGDYIKIGGATLSWDSTNSALKIDTGVYSDSFVSAHGLGPSGGGGGDVSIETFALNTYELVLKLTGQTARRVNLYSLRSGLVDTQTLQEGYLSLSGGQMKNSSVPITNIKGLGFSESDSVEFNNHGNIKLSTTSEYWRVDNKSGQVILACYQNTQSTYEGRVGIGTVAPEHKLHVNGDAAIENSVSSNADLYFYSKLSGTSAKRASVGYHNLLAYIANESSGARIGVADNGNPKYWADATGADAKTLLHSGNLVTSNNNLTGITVGNTTYNVAGGTDENVKIEKKDSDSSTKTYYPVWVDKCQNDAYDSHGFVNSGLKYLSKSGTSGLSILAIGNGDPKKVGSIRIYASSSYYGEIKTSTDSVLNNNHTYQLPNKDGTFAMVSDIPSSTDFVTRSTAQEITGVKTFKAEVKIGTSGEGNARNLTVIGNVGIGSSNSSSNYSFYAGGKSKFNNNVGIGVDPDSGTTYKLKVSGASQFDGAVTVTGSLSPNGNINKSSGTLAIQGPGNTQNLVLCTGGGNVGIGTTSIGSYKLKVDGTSYFSDVLSIAGTVSELSTNPAYNNFKAAKFYVKGTAVVNGTIWYGGTGTLSDMRLKNVIKSIDDVDISKIAQAPIFNFTWKGIVDEDEHLGTSAQYWRDVLPKAVKGDDGLAMDYGATALAAAVMTARKVVTHEERIKALEDENKRLRKEIKTLKAA